jgi:hypothetical protein
VVLTMPLLEGLDGVHKMSKSLGNYIGISEPAIDIVTKTMKIDDDLMWRWIELLSFDIGMAEATSLREAVPAAGSIRARSSCASRANWPRFHDAALRKGGCGLAGGVTGQGDTSLAAAGSGGAGRRLAHCIVAHRRGPDPEQLRGQPQAQGACRARAGRGGG